MTREAWLIDFNHVRPHDALAGKTSAEVHRESEGRAVVPRVPNYPSEWITRRVNETGCMRVNGDTVFVSTALPGMLVGLRQVSLLRWRARFFDVDLGIIEVAPLSHLFGDSPIEPVIAVHDDRPPRARKTPCLEERPNSIPTLHRSVSDDGVPKSWRPRS